MGIILDYQLCVLRSSHFVVSKSGIFTLLTLHLNHHHHHLGHMFDSQVT